MLLRAGSTALLLLLGCHAMAAPASPPVALKTLPPEVAAAMDRARVPRESLSAVVQEVGRGGAPRLS